MNNKCNHRYTKILFLQVFSLHFHPWGVKFLKVMLNLPSRKKAYFLSKASLKIMPLGYEIQFAGMVLPLLMNRSPSCSLEKPASTLALTISHVNPAAICLCCDKKSGISSTCFQNFLRKGDVHRQWLPSCREQADVLRSLASFLLGHGK